MARELSITRNVAEEMVLHCFEAVPQEGCGLLAGVCDTVTKCYPIANAAASAHIYELDSEEYLAADKDATDNELEILGVFHSHPTTEAYPSSTDVLKAPVADWCYVIVSFASGEPEVRSYSIVDGTVTEEVMLLASA